MAIKIKNRDPKTTEFRPEDIVINAKQGTLFYKNTNNTLFKIQGDNLSTSDTEFLPDNYIKGDFTIEGNIVPSNSETFDLGSSTNIWHTLHVKDDSIKMYKDGKEVGKIQYESGSGLRVRDKEGNIKGIRGNIDGGSF
tara:strand:+ start:332 stop:745 length:414 start_codon:yes stop_codon:yes gene_type:complete